MSVAQHLRIRLCDYDRRIRTFIPYYAEMLNTVAAIAAREVASGATIVDLGTGTGSLAARCLARTRRSTLHGIDADRGMLRAARHHLRRYSGRVSLEHAPFARATLPPCDAIVATLALHHFLSVPAKERFYRRCYRALRPGGVLVSGDAFVSDKPSRAEAELEPWRRHMRRTYPPRSIERFLGAWAREDRYLPTSVELRLLAAAGFDAEVAWRRAPVGIVVGRKA